MNFRELTKPALNAIKSNWRPIVLIQIGFLVFVFLYYRTPSLQKLPESVKALRSQFGLAFTLVSIWIASLVVPEIAKFVTRQNEARVTWKDVPFLMAYYGCIGFLLDVFYSFIGRWVGADASFWTVVKKVLLDQLVFSIFLSMPLGTLVFMFRDGGFKPAGFMKLWRAGEFPKRFFPLLITCWLYFGPVTVAMYSLPVELNFPVSMAAQAAWGIIIVAVASKQ